MQPSAAHGERSRRLIPTPQPLRRVLSGGIPAALVVAALAGAGPPGASAAPPAVQSQQAVASQAQVDDTDSGIIDRVLLRVSGRAILYSDFESRARDQLSAIAGQIPQDQIDAQLPALRMRIMQAMVEEVMMQQRAEELGLVADPNDVDRAIMRIREENDILDDAAWQQTLAQNGYTEARLREEAAESLVNQMMMVQEISRQVFVSQREVASYYEANVDQFTEPEQVLYQQIVFAFNGADHSAERELAENALTELRAGLPLSAVGNKYKRPQDVVQDAASASWVSPNDIQPEVRAVVETLTPLDYSEIVEGKFGYHIIQLMDRKEGVTQPFEQVADGIKRLLTNQKMMARRDEYTRDLIKKSSLEIYADEFIDLPDMWSEETEGGPTGTPGQRR